jgi:hypothetical protein
MGGDNAASRGTRRGPSDHVTTPASGVRAAPSSAELAPRPSLPKLDFDANEMTRVNAPPPALLAMARGATVQAPRRWLWFLLGTGTGALAMWLAIGEVRTDVYAARVWAATTLRSLRGASDPVPEGAPIDTPSSAPSREAVPTVDVSQLPHADPAPAIAAPKTGAPALPNAPGPH